jgi:hypothetical protein
MGVLTSFLEREYASSPVPVLQCSNREWRKVCKSKGIAFGSGFGGYYPEMQIPNAPVGLVLIDQQLPNYKQLAVFYHELTHVQCRHQNCSCFTEHGQLSGVCEHHAQLGAMLKCSQRNQLQSLAFAMRYASRLATMTFKGDAQKGARMTVLHPVWDHCRKQLGGLYESVVGHGCSTVALAA